MKNVEHSVSELAERVQAEHQATLKIIRKRSIKRTPDPSIILEAIMKGKNGKGKGKKPC